MSREALHIRRTLGAACAGLALLGLGLGAAACSSLARGAGEADLVRQIRGRGLDPEGVIIPWRINAEMSKWARQHVPDNLTAEERLQRLLNALLGSDGLALEYKAGTTTTAEEVFASRHANCLAFTSLFVGLGRDLGVEVFYLDVGDIEKYERDGNLVVESGHVTAGYGAGSLLRVLEFTPIGTPNYRQLHHISDLTAIALFYSNRGAEYLRTGKEQEALPWLRKAIALDPELARGWINYGVALRRTGDVQGAEAAYRKALEDDPSSVAAYQNLAALLFASGRTREGNDLMTLSGRLDTRNPFNFLALGDVSLAHGRPDEARAFYRKAQRLEGAEAESAAALGQLALATGDRRGARRWLHKAASRDSGNERVQRLAAQLGETVSRPAPRAPATPAAGPTVGHPLPPGPSVGPSLGPAGAARSAPALQDPAAAAGAPPPPGPAA